MSWGNLKMIHEVCDDVDYSREMMGERVGDAGMAYQEGYRKGFADAMREVSGGYGQRDRMPSGYGERRMPDGYGERHMPPYYPEYPAMGMREHYDPMMGMRDYPDEMGERRRRRANGQYM